ncbi:MAG TPA: exodeoxyribonuclease V subunit gamma [Marmoricola sp.]|nr:exodeoxyribonuclease V subunit gamma [Marmoricola sp.]
MALIVHRAADAAELVEGLAAELSRPVEDSFAKELVVVPERGVERWLSQRLSHRLGSLNDDGVCAGVDFIPPYQFRRLVGEVEGGPWSVGELTWTVLATIDGSLDEPWCFTLAQHLGHFDTGDAAELKRGRRFATAQRLARLFTSYVSQRPDMLVAWESGQDVDGLGSALPGDLSWQPALWRRVVAGRIGPVQEHAQLCAEVAHGRRLLGLPSRISLFGHTRISEADLQLIEAVAAQCEVHLWLPHPSPDLWNRVRALEGQRARKRSDDLSYVAAVHPLLAAWGRDSRELQLRLGNVPETEESRGDVTEPRATLLGTLQSDIVANRRPTRWPSTSDSSISVHSCHGPSRQVEVLRELLVGMLQDDPTLQPRDIVVMCPDIEAYAPLIEAAFGLGDIVEVTHPGQRLRVRLADRSLVQTNPLMGVVAALLNLAAGRAEASRILDFLALPPVRRRFGFTEDDLEKIVDWVEETGIRWAFDASRRAEYGLEGYAQNTWQFGLNRLLAGVALSDDSQMWLDQTLPLDDVGSSDIDLVGRFAEAIGRLTATADALHGRHPLAHWLDTLNAAAESLAMNERDEDWQLAQVRRELGALLAGAEASGQIEAELSLSDVRALVADRVAGRPTRANFRTGSLTVCTMTPMRSVPHRVVCLLGLDDGVFPRSVRADGDDVLARTPAIGDRDARSEDRQLLLDAVLAATDRLIITYSGRNEVTGETRPPAVVLGELLDVLHAMAPDTDAVRQEPLQAFSDELLNASASRSFDLSMERAALAAREMRVADRALGEAVLSNQERGDVELDDLLSFLADPVRAFLRNRLEVLVNTEEDERSDELPIELNGLDEWQVGDRMLRELFEGAAPQNVLDREWRRGVLPPGRLGWAKAQEILQKSGPLASMAHAITQGQPASARDITVDLGGRLLTGTVTDLFDTRVVKMTYSKMGPKPQLQAWVSLLALAADAPGRGWTAGALGRGSRAPAQRVTFMSPQDPLAVLKDLVGLYDAGMTSPLPLPLKTSYAWAEGYRQGGASRAAAWARGRWDGGNFPGERDLPTQRAIWGSAMTWDRLVALQPHPDEDPTGVGTRLGALALTLWGPLMDRAHSSAGDS